jgi:hypothetical protein
VSGCEFTRPGQVAPDRPAPDRCMACGQPEAGHAHAVNVSDLPVRKSPPRGHLLTPESDSEQGSLAAELAGLREEVAELRARLQDVARLAEIVTGAPDSGHAARQARIGEIMATAGLPQPPPPRHLHTVKGGKQ